MSKFIVLIHLCLTVFQSVYRNGLIQANREFNGISRALSPRFEPSKIIRNLKQKANTRLVPIKKNVFGVIMKQIKSPVIKRRNITTFKNTKNKKVTRRLKNLCMTRKIKSNDRSTPFILSNEHEKSDIDIKARNITGCKSPQDVPDSSRILRNNRNRMFSPNPKSPSPMLTPLTNKKPKCAPKNNVCSPRVLNSRYENKESSSMIDPTIITYSIENRTLKSNNKSI